MAKRRGRFPDEGEFRDARPTEEEVQAAIDIIRRMHSSEWRRMAEAMPMSWRALIKVPEVQEELGDATVVQIRSIAEMSPDKAEQAALRLMRRRLYETW